MNSKQRFWTEKRQKLKEDLDSRRLPCAVAIPESKYVENIGGIIRTANAFLIQEVIMDKLVYNKAATAGTERWENIVATDDILEYIKEHQYVSIALEQHERSVPLWDFEFPLASVIIVGHEVQGMSDEMVDKCDHVIEIPQFGLVESLNVATATSIALYEYCRQHRQKPVSQN